MKKMLFLGILLLIMTLPVSAAGIVAPTVPDDAAQILPEEEESFGESLWYMIRQAFDFGKSQMADSAKMCAGVIATTLILSLIRGFDGRSKAVAELAGILVIAVMLVGSADSMIETGTETVWKISEYGKLLLPVMTAALAAQGGTATATSLYGATALFDTLICNLISSVLTPMVYIYLLLAIVNGLSEDGVLQKLKDFCKTSMGWTFKILLYIFTGYITISGVISGSADQTALKATKLTISGMIPVVGGILSDASETVLVSAAVVKNTVGVSGMLAVLAVTITPFLSVGIHYLLLKLTAAVCAVFAPKALSTVLDDFSTAMGFVLAMIGSVCLIQLISVVCFLKGMT